jgi:hypothetical protein
VNFEEALALGKARSDCAPENLDSLVGLIAQLDDRSVPGDIAECGSYRCGATIAMAAASPKRTVWAFDLFGGAPPYPANRIAGFAHVANGVLEEVAAATQPFPNIWLVPGLHESRVPHFHRSLALVFMDSDFYETHLVCLRHLWPLLSPGGVIVFHDAGFAEVQTAIENARLPDSQGMPLGVSQMRPVPGSPNMGMIRKPAARVTSDWSPATDHEAPHAPRP